VFWVHASSQARFKEGYRKIADRVKLPGLDDPEAKILQIVNNWLSDESNGQWLMIVDNVDDAAVFFNLSTASSTTDSLSILPPLSNFLPQSRNGSIIITSRRRDVAFRLTESHRDIITVEAMDEHCALTLLRKKLESTNQQDIAVLVKSLDYMPLAITQAAAYINLRSPRYSASRYLAEVRASDKDKIRLLQTDVGDIRRDGTASNAITTTWQISFEHIRQERPSAAQLLSLMSLFDRQGIPYYLLRKLEDVGSGVSSNVDAPDDMAIDFEEDIYTLASYSLISSNIDRNTFEMHQLVQFSTRKWLELCGELERWTRTVEGKVHPDYG
jgi:hypothetical protein